MSEHDKYLDAARRFVWTGSLDGGLGCDTDEAERRDPALTARIEMMANFAAALVRRAVEDARAEEREDAEKYRWCIKSAAWHRGEESAYVAIPVDRDADLSCAAMMDHAIAAAIRARGSKEGR